MCFRGCADRCGHWPFAFHGPKRPFTPIPTPTHKAFLGGGVPGALECAVDRGPTDAEEFSDLCGGVFAALVDLDQVFLPSFE